MVINGQSASSSSLIAKRLARNAMRAFPHAVRVEATLSLSKIASVIEKVRNFMPLL